MRTALALAVLLALGGCSSDDQQDLTVFAASSLKAPFTAMAETYERDHPGTEVTVNFAGSADLVAQLDQGAPADVLATADEATMTTAVDAGSATAPEPFATNTMRIVVPAGNPGAVTGLRDLADPSRRVVICAPQVPCGAATERIEEQTGVKIAADSEESAVTDVLGKVAAGEADAGVVYRSDVLTAGSAVEGIGLPDDVDVVNTYPIAATSAQGSEFVDLVLSDRGRQIMADHGFGPP